MSIFIIIGMWEPRKDENNINSDINIKNGIQKLEIKLNSALNHFTTQQLEEKNKIVKLEITHNRNIQTFLR